MNSAYCGRSVRRSHRLWNCERTGKVAGHAFISYGREDSGRVDQLQRTLEAAGITVWRDKASLWPGEDWRAIIRRAITDNALVFIACFSRSSLARKLSYQNEELVLAIEQLRLRRPDDPWLIPVRFDECDIPDHEIGGGRRLASIQRADLFGGKKREDTERLVAAIKGILEGKAGQPGRLDGSGRHHALAVWLGRRWRVLVPTAAVTVVALVLTLLLAPGVGTGRPSAPSPSNQRTAARNSPSGTPAPRSSSAPSRAALSITTSFLAPGSQADALAFDGTDLWTSDNSGSIFQVDVSGQAGRHRADLVADRAHCFSNAWSCCWCMARWNSPLPTISSPSGIGLSRAICPSCQIMAGMGRTRSCSVRLS